MQDTLVEIDGDWYVTTPNPQEVIEAAVAHIGPALALTAKLQSTRLLPDENVTVSE